MRSRNDSPGLDGDAHDDAVGEHLGAAGDRRAVAAALADDRRGLAGDRRLVDRGDALDDLAVAGDDLARPRPRRRRPCAGSTAETRLLAARPTSLRAIGLLAHLAQRGGLRLARPSATASAKLAKRTVNHSHSVTWAGEPERGPRPRAGRRGRGARASGGEDAAHLDHEHHRVLGHLKRGSSFRKLSRTAGPQERAFEGSDSPRLRGCHGSEHLSGLRRGSARRWGRGTSAGKKVSAPTIDDHADEQGREERPVGGERARARAAPIFLPTMDAGDGQRGDDHQEAADEHGQAEGDVVPGRVGVEPGEGRAVVAGGAA